MWLAANLSLLSVMIFPQKMSLNFTVIIVVFLQEQHTLLFIFNLFSKWCRFCGRGDRAYDSSCATRQIRRQLVGDFQFNYFPPST